MSSNSTADGADPFDHLFARHAWRARAAHVLRRTLHGVALGITLAGASLATTSHFVSSVRPIEKLGFGLVGMMLGAGAALVVARRQAWTDVEVALFFDRRLGTREAIVTALELPHLTTARRVGGRALRLAPPLALRVAILEGRHWALAAAGMAFVLATLVPHPAPIALAKAPGSETLVLTKVKGLERLERLGSLSTRDEAQRDRLLAIAKEARKLREDLAKGLAKRDAQDRTARLADALRAERLTLGSGDERKGLEHAIAVLEREGATRQVAKELGDHDVDAMDRELERHANAREEKDRERAKKALEEAEKAAQAAGASGVARSVAEERELLEKRAARADALREIASALHSKDVAEKLGKLDESPSDANARELADALAEAVSKLSKEEREKLAAKLVEHQAAVAGSRREGASPPPSVRGADLERRLREMAHEDDATKESARDNALASAQQDAEEAANEVSPSPAGSGARRGDRGTDSGEADGRTAGRAGLGGPSGQPGAGSHHDTGRGNHEGAATEHVLSPSFKARARGPLRPGPQMPGSTTAWRPGEAGGTADVRGAGALGTNSSDEISGTERSEVPQEYRDQVHKYFRP